MTDPVTTPEPTATRPLRVMWLVKGLGPGGAENLLVSAATVHDRDAFRFEVEYLLPWKDALVPPLEALGVRTHCLEVRDERDLRWAARLRARLLRDPVDILHAHSPYPAGIARLVVRSLPRRVRPRLMYTVHNTFPSFSPPTRILNGLTYPLDDVDLAVSTEVHDTIWPRLRGRTEVVVHGVLVDAVQAQLSERDSARAELGLDPDEIVVGTVANFRAQKDYPNLLATARVLIDRGWRGRIVAVGQGPLEAEMRALHAQLGLGDRVLLLGQRDDAVRVLAACDVFTMASDNEGLPVALMEALALGLPVAATTVGGIPEAVTDGVEGLLVPPKQPEALADAIEAITSDPERRAQMAVAARARGETFDIRNAVTRLEAIYREVAARPRRRSGRSSHRHRRPSHGPSAQPAPRSRSGGPRPATATRSWRCSRRRSAASATRATRRCSPGSTSSTRSARRPRGSRSTAIASPRSACSCGGSSCTAARSCARCGQSTPRPIPTTRARACSPGSRCKGSTSCATTSRSCSTPRTTRAGPATSRWGGRRSVASPRPCDQPGSRPRSRILTARVPAERWSAPSSAGVDAAEVLADGDALEALLESVPPPPGLSTRRSVAFLRWRYGTPLLAYRAVVAPGGPRQGVAFFRIRNRGARREAALSDVITAGSNRHTEAALTRAVVRAADADYVLRLGGGPVAPGGLVRMPGQGPLLTWRAVGETSPPARWDLTLGDIELF